MKWRKRKTVPLLAWYEPIEVIGKIPFAFRNQSFCHLCVLISSTKALLYCSYSTDFLLEVPYSSCNFPETTVYWFRLKKKTKVRVLKYLVGISNVLLIYRRNTPNNWITIWTLWSVSPWEKMLCQIGFPNISLED